MTGELNHSNLTHLPIQELHSGCHSVHSPVLLVYKLECLTHTCIYNSPFITHCDIHENLWALQVLIDVFVAVTLYAAVGTLHTQLSAVRQSRNRKPEWLREVVCTRLQKNCSLYKIRDSIIALITDGKATLGAHLHIQVHVHHSKKACTPG